MIQENFHTLSMLNNLEDDIDLGDTLDFNEDDEDIDVDIKEDFDDDDSDTEDELAE